MLIRSPFVDVAIIFSCCVAVLSGCSSGEREQATGSAIATLTPTPAIAVATKAAEAAGSPDGALAVAPTPSTRAGTPSPDEMWQFVEEALEKTPTSADFEIDAVASSYYGPAPNTVFFLARALNGTAPFKYTWKAGQGDWAPAEGDRFFHTFEEEGQYEVTVTGTDANGDTSDIQLRLKIVSPEEYVRVLRLDPKLLDNLKVQTSTPARTPAGAPANAGH